jgi:hypothetical protein
MTAEDYERLVRGAMLKWIYPDWGKCKFETPRTGGPYEAN